MPEPKKKELPEKEISFEAGIHELDRIVSKLEQGEISLDESFTLYQQGVTLSKICSQHLLNMEQKIQTVSLDTGELDEKLDFA